MDARPLAGKVALVTGAGIRLGRAIALALGRAGADVAVHFHSSGEAARETAAALGGLGVRSTLVQADQADPGEVRRMFGEVDAALGGLDVLVNSAGILERRYLEDIDDAAWRRMIDIDLSGPFYACREAAPRFDRRGGGAIVNVVDVAVELPWPAHAHYCAAKAGLAGLTRQLAVELAPRNIRVNGVAPGAVLVPADYDEAKRARIVARVPMKREGSPEDVADTVVFLAAGPSYLTGQIVAVDGGRSLV